MSDVLVKGMNMPTACRHGECNFACSAAYQTGMICIIRKQYVVKGDVPVDCPCSIVPPHGRLIDADALLATIRPDQETDNYDGCTFATVKALMRNHINAAQTIIPADDPKEET